MRFRSAADAAAGRGVAGRSAGVVLAAAGTASLVAGGFSVVGGAVAAAGVAAALVPWSRWRREALLVLVAVALAGLASARAEAQPYLVAGYVAVFAFAGLTQSPRAIVAVAPAAALSALAGAAATGSLTAHRLAELVVTVATATIVGFVFALLGEERGRAVRDVGRVFAGTRAVDAATTPEGVAEALEAALADVLDADVTYTFAGSGRDARSFVRIGHGPVKGPGGDPTEGAARALVGALAAVSAEEVLGAETVARLLPTLTVGERVVIDDAGSSDLVEPGRPMLDGVRAMLVVPLPGDDGTRLLGFAVVGWHRPAVGVGDVASQAVELLVVEAARVLRREQHAAQLSRDALTDPLTGLLNRRAIERQLDGLDHGDVVVVLDLDHFSGVNDRHGHAAGDRTLRSLAACLVDSCRKRDWCGRLGGEEFVLVVRGAGNNPGNAIARLRERWHTLDPLTTFSAGVAVHRPGSTAWQTLTEADEALYRAKERGRDRVEVRGQQV